jgi:hypothetical protein
MRRFSNLFLIVLFIILFSISTTLVLIASTARTPLPVWGGYLDVGIVVLLAFAGIMIHQRNRSAPRYDISHQIAVYLFPVVLVGMWIFRDSIDFNILLPGLAWRTYFFLSILPHSMNLWKLEQHQ